MQFRGLQCKPKKKKPTITILCPAQEYKDIIMSNLSYLKFVKGKPK